MSIDGHSSAPGASIHVNHWCEHEGCKQWGCYGHSPRKDVPARWWCAEHFPHKFGAELEAELKARG
ncbi:hypothetical protein DEM27_10235 [Metarhizobium album]|uniref:Uncharacterized protein n=1 Tax=Metarhizobium album TaxID=2182425 RepID=A0A2U2DTV2_9HYPH|nr:hypothetical protein [Rhizobium album]PWE56732.1 hypothetical protein DEM27_10235 [Rhizobium album]